MTKATWSIFLPITPNTSWHNRPKRVSLYLAQKAGYVSFLLWGPGVMLLFPTSLLQRNLTGHSPWGCRVRHDLATKQLQQLLQNSVEAEWGKAERSHSGGRPSPPTKVAESQDSCLSCEALARISEKSKDRCFLCHGCRVTQFPACSAGFLRGASGIPRCGQLPEGLLGTNNTTQPSKQLAHIHKPVPELGNMDEGDKVPAL